MDTKKAFVSLGSNLGNREAYLRSALEYISSLPDTTIISKSSVMNTSPVGVDFQDDYLDQVIIVTTSLQPLELLRELKRIERILGRKDRPRWSEREIDLDIVIYEGVNMRTEELTVPHPELTNRLFLMKACAELDPDYIVEGLDQTTRELYFNNIERLRGQRVELQ